MPKKPPSSSDQAPKQSHDHRFQKGQSGNPGGRPKVALAWKERCRAFLEDEGGWDQLVSITGMVLSEPSAALGALKLMAEYAYGKPQQNIDVTTAGETIKAYIGVDLDRV